MIINFIIIKIIITISHVKLFKIFAMGENTVKGAAQVSWYSLKLHFCMFER